MSNNLDILGRRKQWAEEDYKKAETKNAELSLKNESLKEKIEKI